MKIEDVEKANDLIQYLNSLASQRDRVKGIEHADIWVVPENATTLNSNGEIVPINISRFTNHSADDVTEIVRKALLSDLNSKIKTGKQQLKSLGVDVSGKTKPPKQIEGPRTEK